MIACRLDIRSRLRHEAGFTLIEVLVSLVLLTLVLALLTGGFRFARGTWDAAARLDEQLGTGPAENFVRARLSEATPVFEQSPAGTLRVAFQGSSEFLSFVAPAWNGPLGASLYRYVLELAPSSDGGSALVVKASRYQPRSNEREAEERNLVPHVLMPSVRSVRFRYFGRSALRTEPSWHPSWTRTDALPDLVELSLERNLREGPSALTIELKLRRRQ